MSEEQKNQEQIINEEQPKNSGSSYLKFNSLDDLKNAYQNLEKEFTKKSQLLKKLENEKLDNDAKLNIQTENLETEKPYWESEDWNKKIVSFFEDNPLAKNYLKQISQMVVEDKELQKSDAPLEKAWLKWLENNFKTPEQLLADEEFLKQIKSNEQLKKEIISDYLSQIKNNDFTPPIYLKSGTSGVIKNSLKAKSLEEVKELARKIFSK